MTSLRLPLASLPESSWNAEAFRMIAFKCHIRISKPRYGLEGLAGCIDAEAWSLSAAAARLSHLLGRFKMAGAMIAEPPTRVGSKLELELMKYNIQ